jgi:hypothetical protein
MRNYKKYIIVFFVTIGVVFTLATAVFFSQDTSIKVNKSYAVMKRMIGIGQDYSAFTANSINDYLDIIVRGLKYNLGIDNKPYATVNLIVGMNEMSDLNQQRSDRAKRHWVKAKLTSKDTPEKKKLYKVKVRSKGDRALHVSTFDTMSFKVDIKGSKRLHGLEEFSIQSPIIRNYGWEIFVNNIGSKMGLMAPKIIPINFSFNGDSRGIYVVEEGFNSEFLERRGKKVGPIFSLNEPMGEVFPSVVYEPYEAKKINSDNEIIYDNARRKLLSIKSEYKNNNFDPSLYFDLRQWATFFSVIDLVGSYHGAVPKSVKLYFNPSTQLFEPVFFDNHLGGRGYTKFSLMDFKYIQDYSWCGMACEHSEWFDIFFKDEGFFSIYTNTLERLINKYNDGYFDDIKTDVELFNNAMYSKLYPSDRVFYSGLFPYYFDINHISRRIKLLKNKLSEYAGFNYKKNTRINYDLRFTDNYFTNNLLSQLPQLNDYCNKFNMNRCTNGDVNFMHKKDFSLSNEVFSIPGKTVLILSGNTDFRNSTIIGSTDNSMIVQIGGKFSAINTKFDSFSNIHIAGTNWSGGINLISSDVYTKDLSISNSTGEDAINFVDSKVISVGDFKFDNINEDALDGDSMEMVFGNIICKNVGNDCLDTSNSNIKGDTVVGFAVQDKLVSFGEGSNAHINSIECMSCGIGIAVKDSSFAEINSILFKDTPLEIAVFQKKNIFNAADLVINNTIVGDSSKRLVGKNCSLTESGYKTIGNLKSKDVKKLMYGNQYGRASNK